MSIPNTAKHRVIVRYGWLLLSCAFAMILQQHATRYGWAGDVVEATGQLRLRQEQVAEKYSRLEALLLRMADVDAANHPRRAAVLRRAVSRCNERHVKHQLNLLVRLLSEENLDQAVDRQKTLRQEFHNLLELLLKEGRSKRLQDEQSRVRDYIKEIERLLRRQRGLQGRTEGGDSTDTLTEQQLQLSQRTGTLGQQMKENEEQSSNDEDNTRLNESKRQSSDTSDPPADTNPEQAPENETPEQLPKGDQEKSPPKATEEDRDTPHLKKNGNSPESKDNNQTPAESDGDQENQPHQQGESKPDNTQQQGGGQEAPSSDSQAKPFRPRQSVDEAQRRMEHAQKKLRNGRRDEATMEQQKAQQELRKALAELEEILRQMREEEAERMLAMLESRFRKMLQMQLKVYEQTQQLDDTPTQKRDFELDIQAGQLGFQQRKIVVEADRTLTLLQDEGSSIAFPEVVGQARDDMQQVAERLAVSKIGPVTQGIQQDIIAALEEMIAALQLEQKQRDQQQQPLPSPSGKPNSEQALVDTIAELRMIRSMENRIYQRTKRYAKLLTNADDPAGQADDPELSSALRQLGQRQQRIRQITRDIVLGKNQ